MYLKSLEINNFRKFRAENNIVEFVDAESYRQQKEGKSINVAPTTTLIVGKNNSGKTTITKVLEKLINDNNFEANDFNFSYLKEILHKYEEGYKSSTLEIESPFLEFKLTIGIEDKSEDLITNLVPFMTLDDVNNSELDILVKYELVEKQTFQNSVVELLKDNVENDDIKFKKFLGLIGDSSDFKIRVYNASGFNVQFKIRDLIEIKTIKANNVENDKCLSRAFSKIIEYRYKSSQGEKDKKVLESEISKINSQLSSDIKEKHTDSINNSLKSIESSDKLKMLLSSDITFKKLMSDLIKYEYVEQGNNIPENQFGLGYTNLMMIIADLIEYMEKYPEQSFNSKVNLISIEEPETFMHPQMQEMFIKHINEAIASLLKNKQKNINSQLIITTHSSHILNSKIHSGNTFNNINYITAVGNNSNVVTLNDVKITPSTKADEEDIQVKENNLKFLKKHIKYKVSELFFSDAIIFVEGITEETLLKYYIDKNDTLKKYYISIFNIDGAHGLVYHKLIKLLRVPALIITDLDIKRSEEEKDNFTQITTLTNRETTNKTITKYHNSNANLNDLPVKIEDDNFRISYQGKINGFYATSFEEAFILTNFRNTVIKQTLNALKPDIIKKIIGDKEDLDQIRENSYKLQQKLSSSKSNFANKLLYEFIIADEDVVLPELPKYISEGFDWLSTKLNGGPK
jgi:predicted ATP-dependent endonuclease of OLD family